jgi:hypothetical protein
MKIKWTFEFEFPIEERPIVRDTSRWLNNSLVEVEGLTFVNGLLAFVLCDAQSDSRSHSPVVYRTADTAEGAGDVIPDRKELNRLLPKVVTRARAEALVSAARQVGLPDPFMAVRGMLLCQEEFIRDINGIYEALSDIEATRHAK